MKADDDDTNEVAHESESKKSTPKTKKKKKKKKKKKRKKKKKQKDEKGKKKEKKEQKWKQKKKTQCEQICDALKLSVSAAVLQCHVASAMWTLPEFNHQIIIAIVRSQLESTKSVYHWRDGGNNFVDNRASLHGLHPARRTRLDLRGCLSSSESFVNTQTVNLSALTRGCL